MNCPVLLPAQLTFKENWVFMKEIIELTIFVMKINLYSCLHMSYIAIFKFKVKKKDKLFWFNFRLTMAVFPSYYFSLYICHKIRTPDQKRKVRGFYKTPTETKITIWSFHQTSRILRPLWMGRKVILHLFGTSSSFPFRFFGNPLVSPFSFFIIEHK